MRERLWAVLSEWVLVAGVAFALSYVAAVVVCRIVTRWLGGAF